MPEQSRVKSIVKLHQGTVTVNSEVGQGVTVILRFPFKKVVLKSSQSTD